MISFEQRIGCSVVFSTNSEKSLKSEIAGCITKSQSAGWCTQPWPGTSSWPMSPLIPVDLYGQCDVVASLGEGWCMSAWPGKGVWPFTRPNKILHGQYKMQSNDKSFKSQITQFLTPSQTNLGSNETGYCERPYCSSGVYVANAWMFKPIYTQNIFALKASTRIYSQILIPTKVRQTFNCGITIIFPVENSTPKAQIHIHNTPIYFAENVLCGQYLMENSKHLICQWKKRPF